MNNDPGMVELMKSPTVLLASAAVIGIALVVWYQRQSPAAAITSFDDCAAAGYAILESYPAQCRTPDGASFTQNIGNELEKTDVIQIDYP